MLKSYTAYEMRRHELYAPGIRDPIAVSITSIQLKGVVRAASPEAALVAAKLRHPALGVHIAVAPEEKT